MIIHTGDLENFKHCLLIFQIPPLVPKSPLLGTEEQLPEVAPILTFEYSDAAIVAGFPIPDCWYNDDLSSLSLPFYVVRSRQQCNVGQYKLNIASDLSNLSLTPINAHRVTKSILEFQVYCSESTHRICENRSVNIFSGPDEAVEANTLKASFDLFADTLNSSQAPTTSHLNMTPLINTQIGRGSYSFCPASGRFIYGDIAGKCVICDFLSD